ncbi:phage tail sheath family protein [Cyclobacterium amurskyense]|uniref:Cytoplasmic fibril protein n=1 Tax=Cyclobacterium amurskyense TaxID=320787 RepID=A0A0H4PGH8_9BACT|nr:phage tail sheath C-terminal domain-containing protein [Cyclobacterium amurskyense]AKP53314.1 Cytoplasmic fibril protein [Cyclobacterium amurskyense]
MPNQRKTPGVYVQELDSFVGIVPVATSIPVFIGYTHNTSYNGEDLRNKPRRVTSLSDYYTIFGNEPPVTQFDLEKTTTDAADFTFGDVGESYLVKANGPQYRMHSALQFFYNNGGEECYVVCVGDYKDRIKAADLKTAVDLLEKETVPTLLIIPEAVELYDDSQSALKDRYKDAYSLQSHMINHCGSMGNRMAILDIPRGYWEPEKNPSESIDAFRDNVIPSQSAYYSFAAAYYPWLHTILYLEAAFSYENLSGNAMITLDTLLKMDASQVPEQSKGAFLLMISQLTGQAAAEGADAPPTEDPKLSKEEQLKIKADRQKNAHNNLQSISKAYKLVLRTIQKKVNTMPPSAAMAGIYTSVDNSRGVWNAPENVSISSVKAPTINVTTEMQGDLNVPLSGLAINAIRTFPGQGVLVWGARTMDGNSQDWRYLNVRRTAIFLEQSIKSAIRVYVYEPNTANIWAAIKSEIANFLTYVWKQGGLMGSIPAEAFVVYIGLGSTMTAEDILNGILRVSVKVALSHPGEFIELSFEQEMGKV